MTMQPRVCRFIGMFLCCLPVLVGLDNIQTLAAGGAPSETPAGDAVISNASVFATGGEWRIADDAGWREALTPTLQSQYLAAVLNEDCQPIAQPSQFLTDRQGPTYWGNAFTMLRDSVLTDFEIELTLFDDPTPLHFSIYRASTPLPPNNSYGFRVLDPIFIGAPIDASPFFDGTGIEQPSFYAAELPAPITLHAGFDYVLGVAWGPEFVELHNDEDNTTYPRSLEGNDGKTLGVTVQSTPTLPLDPETTLSLTVFDFYALSMNLCLEPQPGACCVGEGVGSVCQELNPEECLDPTENNTFTRERLTCEELVTVEELDCPLPDWACCIPGGGCLKLDKFFCETLEGIWHRNKLCTDFPDPCAAKGGCCKAGGTCEIVTEEECDLLDSLYRGDDTTCGTFCVTGACCLPDSPCVNLSIGDCSLNGGAWRGHGSRCATDGSTCDPRGACCNGTTCVGGADGMTEAVCLAGGGLWQGNWTTCDTLDVSCGKGACCTPLAGCRPNLPRLVCEISWSGTYKGDGSDCATVATECLGTCCDSGFCLSSITPVDCSASGTGVFVGYSVSCNPQCDVACRPECDPSCDPDYDPDPCDNVVTSEACCFPDGVCAEVPSAADCTAFSGVAQGVATCGGVTCGEPVIGACCLGGDSCAELTAADCTAASGSYLGDVVDDMTCSLSACGVCCRGRGGGELCDATLDLDACAATAGLCVGGANHGATCYAPGDCLGLCDDGTTHCTSDADCATSEICNEYGGCDAVYGLFFPGEECGPLSCPPAGACCVAGQPCVADVTLHACDQIGGFWEGAGSTCSTLDLCVSKRCCHDDGSCAVATASQCATTGGIVIEGVFDCVTEPLCPDAWACCHDDGSCTMVTDQACTEADGTSHPGEECGVSDTCPPPGRCCLPDETCVDLIETACQSNSGIWDVRFACTSASDSSCTRGACCRIDGTCEDVIGSQCTGEYDDFAAIDCATRPLCIPLGACCTDFDCTVQTEPDCIGGGGLYEGDATTCTPPDRCVPTGACCSTLGVCTDDISQESCEVGGGCFAGGDTICDVSGLCPTGATGFSILGAFPSSDSVDARIPHAMDDAAALLGWDLIELIVDKNACEIAKTSFQIVEVGGDATPPSVTVTTPDFRTVRFELSEPIEASAWIKISHADSADLYCLGALPGDVGGDGTTDIFDVGSLIKCLNDGSCDPTQCDIDRAGSCTGADLAMLINLLNGAGALDSWDAKTLAPSPCL